jgi:Arc/MetJ-type ribon-helix-helix transcriptional regulator
MKRISLFLDESQIEAIEKLTGTFSEHIRRAIDEYLEKIKPKATASPSINKKGEQNAS